MGGRAGKAGSASNEASGCVCAACVQNSTHQACRPRRCCRRARRRPAGTLPAGGRHDAWWLPLAWEGLADGGWEGCRDPGYRYDKGLQPACSNGVREQSHVRSHVVSPGPAGGGKGLQARATGKRWERTTAREDLQLRRLQAGVLQRRAGAASCWRGRSCGGGGAAALGERGRPPWAANKPRPAHTGCQNALRQRCKRGVTPNKLGTGAEQAHAPPPPPCLCGLSAATIGRSVPMRTC